MLPGECSAVIGGNNAYIARSLWAYSRRSLRPTLRHESWVGGAAGSRGGKGVPGV